MKIHLSTIQLVIQAVCGLLIMILPIAFWIIWKKKTEASWKPLLTGIIGYLGIGFMYGLARLAILGGMKDTPMQYYVMQAVFAGVFEEVGRYLIFKYAIPNSSEYRDSVSYGIGHSGAEMIIVDNIGNDIDGLLIGNFVVGMIYKLKGFAPFVKNGLTMEESQELIKNVSETKTADCIMIVLSCITALVLGIALSVLVFTAVHYAVGKKWLIIAIFLHIFADIIGAFHLAGKITMTEANVLDLLFTAAVSYLAYRVWETYKNENYINFD